MKPPLIDVEEGRLSLHLGPQSSIVADALRRLQADRVADRIWNRDHTVWNANPEGLVDRLGWLDLPAAMREDAASISAFADDVTNAGFRHVVLFGMGGSSLAAEVLRQTCAPQDRLPRLIVLDSTIPEAVRATADSIDPAHTLFIVSSKSGTTIEPNILYHFFRDLADRKIGRKRAGGHFVAITDPCTPLERMAQDDGFRQIFTPRTDLGGRYSALSHFGLLPAALAGANIHRILDRAKQTAEQCLVAKGDNRDPGTLLGAALGALSRMNRDKLTLLTSPSVAAFGMWVDQLIAESVGKDGQGIIPVVGEPLIPPECYTDDRVLAYLRVDGDYNDATDEIVARLRDLRHSVIVIPLRDPYDIGGEFFRWEFATAVAASILGVHPFDQPNVQASKEQTLAVLDEIETTGDIPDNCPTESIEHLMEQAQPGDYLAIMAYLRPTHQTDRALADLRRDVGARHQIATTLGYGPRLLHSTGQLHKHGPNTGLFLQITSGNHQDVPIPGKTYSFGLLAKAQAAGDFRALKRLDRRVVRVDAASIPGLT